MNCKPGDLARIVAPYSEAFIGLVVHVKSLAATGERVQAKDGTMSRVTGQYGTTWLCDANDSTFPHMVADDALRPLRDPGEDARDETLSWKRVPSPAKQGEPA